MRRLLFLAALVSSFAAETPTAWTPALSMRVQSVAAVTPSPDGKLAVWTQARAVMEGEKSEYLTHIFLGRADGSHPIQLTRGEKSADKPAFSPDGRFVYFVSERSGKPNLYRLRVAGGEAEKLTDWKGTIGAFQISPDGKQLAFTGADEDKDLEKRKKEKNDYKVIDANPRKQALYGMSLEGELRGKPKKLVEPGYHVSVFDWSPDSRRIAYEHRPTLSANDQRYSDIAEVELAGGQVRELAATPVAEEHPRYSPDGRYLAFLHSIGRSTIDGQRFVLLSRADGKLRELAPTFDERPALIDWAVDSKRILYLEDKGTRRVVYAMPLDGPPVALLAPQRGGPAAGPRLNRTGTQLGLTLETPEEPAEAYVAPVDNSGAGKPVRLSEVNTGLEKPPLGKTELIRWKGKDGLEIEGLLVPLILNIHGGPSGAFIESFIGTPRTYPIAAFAAKGFAVLRANPRGSTGYGSQFRRRVVGDWGGLDYQDLMAGVDHVIAMRAADPEKMAVMGWSYGGYMTAWVVTQTTRFKAAAVGAGITDTVSMYGTQDIPSVFEDYFHGTPWTEPAVYAKSSPLNFIAAVKTPTLILHGENDARVPTSQGYEFYRALKRLGVPTKMVVYPRMPHGPNEPKFALHIMEQHLEWAEKYLR
ncbi:MAG: S9 family peptidase [Acidobacteria bacterium]|nr:S9 family peptidase [Acidobacteriota bacterium]